MSRIHHTGSLMTKVLDFNLCYFTISNQIKNLQCCFYYLILKQIICYQSCKPTLFIDIKADDVVIKIKSKHTKDIWKESDVDVFRSSDSIIFNTTELGDMCGFYKEDAEV